MASLLTPVGRELYEPIPLLIEKLRPAVCRVTKRKGKAVSLKRLSALILVLVLVISEACIPASAKSSELIDYYHEEVDFSTLQYVHYDREELENTINRIGELSKDEKNIEELEPAIIDGMTVVLDLEEALYLSVISYYKDNKDPYWKEEYLYNNEMSNDMYYLFIDNLKAVAASPCRAALYAYLSETGIRNLERVNTPEKRELEYIEKQRQLYTEYLDNNNPTVEYDGEEYDLVRVNKEFENGTLPYFTALKLYNEVWDKLTLSVAGIYLKMIDNNNKMAKLFGFDNYLDYAYAMRYDRDYTPEEALELCNTVRDELSGLTELFEAYDSPWLAGIEEKLKEQDYLELLGRCVGEMAPEFKESYDFMMRTNSFYLIPEDETNGNFFGFTSELRKYALPFSVLTETADSSVNLSSIFHEYGHYNSKYWRSVSNVFLSELDLEETFSQGMEVLAMHYYDNIYGEAGKSAEMSAVGSFLRNVYDACAVTSVEYTAYKGGYKTAEELVKALTETGSGYYQGGIVWFWVDHIFDTPGYYISYVFPALNSLEIYRSSKEDYNAALETYFDLLKKVNYLEDGSNPDSGLTKNWTPKTLSSFLDSMLELYEDKDAPVITGAEDGAAYSKTVKITVSDAGRLMLGAVSGDKELSIPGRSFDIGGSNDPITIIATDGFGNSTQVQFEVEPAPFTVEGSLNEEGGHVLSWDRFPNADGYKVYGAPLGQKYRKLATLDGNETKFVNTESDSRVWKYYVVALYTDENGKKYSAGKSLKSFLVSEENEKYTNISMIEFNGKEELNLKQGKNKKLSVKLTKSFEEKNVYSGKNVKAVRFYSSDENVATVNAKGKITAVAEGSCYIYCISENGMTDSVRVKVG